MSKTSTVKGVLGNVTGTSLSGKMMADARDIFQSTKSGFVETPINQYGPTDYIQSTPSTPSTPSVSTAGEDIFISYSEAGNTVNKMSEIANILNESCNKLESLLTDANNYWKSSAATLFTKKVEEYMTEMKKYENYLDTKSDALSDSSKSYSDFDSTFAQMTIE